MPNLKLFIPFAVFLVLAFFLLWGLERDPNELPSALIDRPVPSFEQPTLEVPDQTVDEGIFEGEVSLLNVWGTWCVACRVEHPFLMELADSGVRIIGMNYKDEAEAARIWLVEKGDPYAINFTDREGLLGIDLGVFGAPETYLIDHEGTIRYKHVGVVNEHVWEELGPLYQQLLARSEAAQ